MAFREHLAVWPMAILMLAMGVASPLWMRAIDGAVTGLVRPAAVKADSLPGVAERQ